MVLELKRALGYYKLCFFSLPQISRWGSVEWAHDLELMETRSRVAAAVLFYSLNNRRRTLPSSS